MFKELSTIYYIMPSNPREYSKNYYHIFKAKKGTVLCPVCQKNINYVSMKKHLQGKKHLQLENKGIDKRQEEINFKINQLKEELNKLNQLNQEKEEEKEEEK